MARGFQTLKYSVWIVFEFIVLSVGEAIATADRKHQTPWKQSNNIAWQKGQGFKFCQY